MSERIKTNKKLDIIIRRLDDEIEYMEKVSEYHADLKDKYKHMITALKWCKWVIQESENVRVY